MLQYGSVIWPQSEKYAPGARQHLLPKPTNIIQLASRDRIPLLVNTWQQPPQRYVYARLFYENDGLLNLIFVHVCLKSSFFCWLADTFCHWLKVTVPLAVTVRYYIIRIWYGDCICCDTPVCVVTLVYVCLNTCMCVCVLANCISANFISIQSGFGLSQVLRHSVEGRKNTCQNIFTLSLIAAKPVGCNLTNDF